MQSRLEPYPIPGRLVEAELETRFSHVSLNRVRWKCPIDQMGRGTVHHLQLSLLPSVGSSRGCFPEYWGPHRFEPIGPLFLCPADQVLHAKSDCAEQQSIVCLFDADAIERWFEGGIDWTSRRLEASLDICHSEIRRLLFAIGRELRSPGFATEAMIELLSAQIAIELSRYLSGIEEPAASGGLAPWRLRAIDEYLSENAARASLNDLAQASNLSVRQLSRAFRASRGRSIGTYIAEFRITLARRLLASGMPVKAVADELGFSTPSNFSAAFQRLAGESPRAYRTRVSRH